MKKRLLTFPSKQTFFLFGARNTGKSTLIKHRFASVPHLYIDLLDVREEHKYRKDPQHLKAVVCALPDATKHIIIDEVQKIPSLLNVVHALIETTDKMFVLTGSSARQLKHGHANLLAGRAFIRHLYPFSFVELGASFELDQALQFGLMPPLFQFQQDHQKADFLRAYTHTYLKEEVWAAHFIRKIEPFHSFLDVAAQTNAEIVNIAKLAKDVGVDDKSIVQYFSILEDTLLGFRLPAFKHSFRKRLTQKSKFYFIDVGLTRALSRQLSLPLSPATYAYGKLFEQFIILECYKLAAYARPDDRFSHMRTHDGLEIDLVVERPGQPLLMIEIKSTDQIQPHHLKALQQVKKDLGDQVETICLARVPQALQYGAVKVYPWQEGVCHYFGF